MGHKGMSILLHMEAGVEGGVPQATHLRTMVTMLAMLLLVGMSVVGTGPMVQQEVTISCRGVQAGVVLRALASPHTSQQPLTDLPGLRSAAEDASFSCLLHLLRLDICQAK